MYRVSVHQSLSLGQDKLQNLKTQLICKANKYVKVYTCINNYLRGYTMRQLFRPCCIFYSWPPAYNDSCQLVAINLPELGSTNWNTKFDWNKKNVRKMAHSKKHNQCSNIYQFHSWNGTMENYISEPCSCKNKSKAGHGVIGNKSVQWKTLDKAGKDRVCFLDKSCFILTCGIVCECTTNASLPIMPICSCLIFPCNLLVKTYTLWLVLW